MQRLSRLTWLSPIVLAFGLAYFTALTFEYVDGDDSASMAYHLLGRDSSIQPPFAAYQPGMDWILSFLPPQDPALRTIAMVITSASALLLAILLLALAFDMIPEIHPRAKTLVATGLILAAPELVYIGLLYTPMLTGMCVVVAGHLLLRRRLRVIRPEESTRSRVLRLLLPMALLMSGGLFRWDLFFYPLLATLDIALDPVLRPPSNRGDRIWKAQVHPVAILLIASAILMGVLILRESLLGSVMGALKAVLSTPKFPGGLVGTMGAYQTLFSPSMVLSVAAGFVFLWRNGPARIRFAFFAIILMALWPLWMSPKAILLFVPTIVALCACGVHFIWNEIGKGHPILVRGCATVVLVLPWLVGIEVQYGDSAWGPGFELRRYDRDYDESTTMRLTLGSGTAIPTPEGPRPLFGHAWCIYGGKWRAFVQERAQEARQVIAHATEHGLPVLVAQGSSSEMIATATEQLFRTQDPPARSIPPGPPEIRRLTSGGGKVLTIVRYPLFYSRYVDSTVQALRGWLGTDLIAVRGYSSTLRTLYLVSPGSLSTLGKNSALLDLSVLETDWRRRRETAAPAAESEQ